MTLVSSSSSLESAGRQTTTRKTPSPYQSIPAKNHHTKSPKKVKRNNILISTSHRNEDNNGDGHRFVNDKFECSSTSTAENLTSGQLEEVNNPVEFVKLNDLKLSAFGVVPRNSRTEPSNTESLAARSISNGSNSKTIKFLLKLTTKSYFETLKNEIDRIKEDDRKLQDLTGSQGHSIMSLNCKAAVFDNQIDDLRVQNSRLLLETIQQHHIQQDMINTITGEMNELKSVCNLLLKSIEKDHELEYLARKLRKSKCFDSDACKMLKSQLRKTIHQKKESKKVIHKSQPRARIESTSKRQKPRVPRRRTVQQASQSGVSSSVVTGSDMLTDIESTSVTSRKTTKSSTKATVGPGKIPTNKAQLQTKKRSGLMKICCFGGRSSKSS